MAEKKLSASQNNKSNHHPGTKSKLLPMKARVEKQLKDFHERGILPKLTPKRKMFLSLYLDINDKDHFFNALRCVKTAFNPKSDDSARSMAWENSELLSPWINQFLDDLAFNENAIKAKVYSLMHARKTQYFAYQGEVCDEREVDALDIQLKAADLAAELKGMKKKADKEPAAVFNINFGDMAIQFQGNAPGSD